MLLFLVDIRMGNYECTKEEQKKNMILITWDEIIVRSCSHLDFREVQADLRLVVFAFYLS